MAKPFTFSTKRAGGNIYVQFALPDGGRTFQKSTRTSNRKEAEKIAMEWLVNGNIPERINSAKPSESKLNMDKLALFNNLSPTAKPAKAESAFTGSLPSKESTLEKSQRMI